MSIKTRVDKLESKNGELVLVVVGTDETSEEALSRYGDIPENSRVLFVSTGVCDAGDD